MSSRIIRSRDQVKKPIIIGPGDDHPSGLPRDHVMNIEKQAFEQGYREGERMGKEMGEKMIETVVKRYDRSIIELTVSHKTLLKSMEVESVRLALEIARSVLEREVTVDPDITTALATLALRKLDGHQQISLRINAEDAQRVREEVENINSNVRVDEDTTLERGDFVLDTHKTHLDGRMKSRLSHVGRALLQT